MKELNDSDKFQITLTVAEERLLQRALNYLEFAPMTCLVTGNHKKAERLSERLMKAALKAKPEEA